MTLLIFLLLAAILLVVLLIVKSKINRQLSLPIPIITNKKNKNNNIIYKSVNIDPLGNFHILTNRGALLKTSDKMSKHQEIPDNSM